MATRTWLAAGLASLLSGCVIHCGDGWESADAGTPRDCFGPEGTGGSPGDNTTVTARGVALRQDGTPSGDHVLMTQGATQGDWFLILISAGLSCLLDYNEQTCGDDTTRLPTDALGAYSFSVPGSETTTSFLGLKSYVDYSVLAQGPGTPLTRDGAWGRVVVNLTAKEVTLPELRLWEPTLTVGTEGAFTTVTHGTPPAFSCLEPSLEVVVEDAEGNPWWQEPSLGQGRLDTRGLEDFSGRVLVVVHYRDYGSEELTLASPRVPVTGTGGTPLSRGAACRVEGPAPEDHGAGHCAATDGAPSSLALADNATGLTVDLGQEQAVQAVTVRGSVHHAVLDVSADGAAWMRLATLDQPFSLTEAPAGTRARWVRVRADSVDGGPASQVRNLIEVSAW